MPRLPGLASRLAEHIRRHGPIRFDAFMEAALYDPEAGFFATGAGAGRSRADFITSAETGPLFGAVLARAFDTWWDDLGRPDPYLVVEAGAGRGALARSVLAARPRCTPALRYVLVERSAALRAEHHRGLPLEPPEIAFAGVVSDDDAGDEDDRTRVPPASGPICVSLAELPIGPIVGVVVANELLDNLPFRLFEDEHEVLVGERDGTFVEILVPCAPPLVVGDDLRFPWQEEAVRWLREARTLVAHGRLCVIDYGGETRALARRGGWLRTYRGQSRGTDPLDRPGTQDITTDVCIDQLATAVTAPDLDRSQAEFLRAHGIDDLVAEGRRTWSERAYLGDLEAMKARSRIREAEALCDPDGLGGFRVWEWVVERGV